MRNPSHPGTMALPEGIESAGHHGHLGALLDPADGVRGDGGDASLVSLGVGDTEIVHTLDILDPPKLYPDLVRHRLTELVQHWLEDRVVHEVERALERTGGEAAAQQRKQEET